MAELGLFAENFLLLPQLCNLFSHVHQSFPLLTATYKEVNYTENRHLVTYTEVMFAELATQP
jgi:hypothetical protein